MRRTAVCISLDYRRNLDMMKELNRHPVMESIENYRCNWKTMFFERLSQKSNSEFSVTDRKEEGVWENPSNAGMRHTWKAEDDETTGKVIVLYILIFSDDF
jgi:hypothetical protein